MDMGKKVANNILEFLIDPTRIPVRERVYFRPEEKLQNQIYESAKADSAKAFKDQKNNSDFYPSKNRSLTKNGGNIMDRKSLVASLDVLSKNFVNPEDPFAVDLRTMAAALAKMDDSALQARLASDAPELEETLVQAATTFKCPTCGTKVLTQTKYCVKCKKKVKSAGEEEVDEKEESKEEACDKEAFLMSNPKPGPIGERFKTLEVSLGKVPGGIKSIYPEFKRDPKLKMIVETQPSAKDLIEKVKTLDKPMQEKALDLMESVVKNASCDFWTKEASNLIARTLVADIIGVKAEDEKVEEKKEEVPAEEKVEAKKEEAPVEEKKEEVVVEAKKEEIPAEEKKEEVVVEAKKEEIPAEEKKEEVEASVVDTDILASYSFAGIEIPVSSMDDVGELSVEEKANLAKLF